MMKRKLLLFLLLLLSFAVKAEDKSHRLVINFTNGEQVNFILNDKPEVTFIGDNIRVKTSMNSIECLRSTIKEFHFEEIATDIEALEYNGNGIITIYDTSGHIIASPNSDFKKNEKSLLESFKPGMYIIKLPNQQTFKYLKK